MKIHPKAMKFYEYNKSYHEGRDAGLSKREAAEKSATEHNTVTEADRKAARLAEKEKNKTDAKTDKKQTVDEQIKSLFGEDGALQKGLLEFGKNARAESTNDSGTQVENAEQKKTESKLDKLKALTAERDAALQPIVQEQQGAPIMAGGGDEIIIPSTEKNDADEYLLGKFGIVAEARSTLVNFM
tara:strand:+ start:69 stop:623 length:555 start_codon:yes stop_codon:yes gene_type:complete